ncbi:MAG: hypothetical protein ABIH82_00040 [Candidatus Woesearchaeota archaeon]
MNASKDGKLGTGEIDHTFIPGVKLFTFLDLTNEKKTDSRVSLESFLNGVATVGTYITRVAINTYDSASEAVKPVLNPVVGEFGLSS